MQTVADSTFPLIRLPEEFRSRRQTTRADLEADTAVDLLRAEGPGCVRHLWLTISGRDVPRPAAAAGVTLQIAADPAGPAAADPGTDPAAGAQVDLPLNQFFGVLLGRGLPYRMESAGIKLLPDNAYNLYLPIPFRAGCRITLRTPKRLSVWAMADWQEYPAGAPVTGLRLHAHHHAEHPAADHGSFPIGAAAGAGFVAGIVKGIRQRDAGDLIYHTGGATWLLDGETDPHALRGINEEDDVNFSFGYRVTCSQWTGCPHVEIGGAQAPEAVAYRFFGPDPIRFRSSLVARAGCRADDTETTLYYYLAAGSGAPAVETPRQWQVSGPMPCEDYAQFRQPPAPGAPIDWRGGPGGEAGLSGEHTWLDLTHCFDTARPLSAVAVYARAALPSRAARDAVLRLGFDDWLTVWVNGAECAALRHDAGFAAARVPVRLRAGDNELLVKLSNASNREFRLWALSCVVE